MRGSPQLLRSKLSADTLQVMPRASSWLPGGAGGGGLDETAEGTRCLKGPAWSGGLRHTFLMPSDPTPPHQQSLEDRLRALDAFLADYLQRRRGRQPAGAAADGAGAGAAQPLPAATRQRLEDAQQAELKRWVTGQACGL